MHPTRDQIAFAAYERWLSRGGRHGFDQSDWFGAEKELRFLLNYEIIAEYRLEASMTRVLGKRGNVACRLCERGPDEVLFDEPCAAIPGSRSCRQLLTAEVCSECRVECLTPLAADFREFLDGQSAMTLGSYKALVAAALLIMPAEELEHFPDAIEWINNPDSTCDAGLFSGSICRAYAVTAESNVPWVRLAKRVDDDAAMPYMVLFLTEGGVVLQLDVPLSLRDEDLDGVGIESPERSWTWGAEVAYYEAECVKVTVEIPGHRHRPEESGLLLRC